MKLVLLSFCASLLLIRAARRAALRLHLTDPPDPRKRHGRPIPLAGGAGIFAAWAALAWLLARDQMNPWLLAGAATVFAGGLCDDWGKSRGHPMGVAAKLAYQTASACMLIAGGIWVRHVRVPLADSLWILPDWLGITASVLWVVGITNFANFIDGMDGLLGSVSAVSAGTLLIAGTMLGTATQPLLCLLLGSLLGFLVDNLPPARVFAGDSGSNLVGFLLAALSLQDYLKTVTVASLGVSLLALSVPLAEGAFAIIRRLLAGKPITAADRQHSFHRMLDSGYGARTTLLVFAGVAAAVSGVGLAILRLFI